MTMDTSDVERGSQRVKGAATEMGGGLRSSLGGIVAIAASAAALVGVSMGMRSIAQNVIQVNSMVEQGVARYKALGASSEGAKKRVEELMQFARTTPFETQSIISAGEKLRLIGGAALDSNKNLRLFGNAATATGQQLDTVSNMMGRLYQSIQNGEPIQRFAVRLERMGILTPEVTKKLLEMQKAHASGAQMWELVTTNIGRFNGAMDAQLGTWEGLNTAIHRTIADLTATAFKPLFTVMEQGLIRLNTWLNSNSVQKAAVAFGQGLASVVTGIATFIGNAWKFLSTDPATKPLRDFFGMVATAVGNFFRTLGATGSLMKSLADSLDALGDPGKHAHDILSSLADVIAPRLRLALSGTVPLMWSAVGAFTAFSLARAVIPMLGEVVRIMRELRVVLAVGGFAGLLEGLGAVVGLTGPFAGIAVVVLAVAAAFAALYLTVKPLRDVMNTFFGWLATNAAPTLRGVIQWFGEMGRAVVAIAVTAWPMLVSVGRTLWATLQTLWAAVRAIFDAFTDVSDSAKGTGDRFGSLSGQSRNARSEFALFATLLAVVVPQALLTLIRWIKVVADAFLGLGIVIGGAGRAMIAMAKGDWTTAINALIKTSSDFDSANKMATEDVKAAWDTTAQWFNGNLTKRIDDFSQKIDDMFIGTGTAAKRGTASASEAYNLMQQDLQKKSVLIQKNSDEIATALPRAVAAQRQATIKSITDTMEGFLRGMNSYLLPVQTTATAIAKAVPDRVAQHGNVHSPSRVMYEMGRDYGRGYELGLGATLVGIATTAQKGAAGVLRAFASQPNPLSAALQVNALPAMARATAVGGPGSTQPVQQLSFTNHFYEADLQASDVSSELAWLMKTRRVGR